jgi:hypothetical protein
MVEDEGVRALYAPRESTSVWRASADPEAVAVATLAQMGDATIPTRDYDAASIVDPARYDASGVVQIQIVKRNGTFVPVVDGLVPPTQTDSDGSTVHLINHHRGMHTDEETQTWVFSPCVASVCVEDGQPMPERCTLSVWQHVARTRAVASLLGGQETIKLGEHALAPFKVSDYSAQVVYAPYPLFHTRAPRVVINDMSSIVLYREERRNAAIWNIFKLGDGDKDSVIGKKLTPFFKAFGPFMLHVLGDDGQSVSMDSLIQKAMAPFGLAYLFNERAWDLGRDASGDINDPPTGEAWYSTAAKMFRAGTGGLSSLFGWDDTPEDTERRARESAEAGQFQDAMDNYAQFASFGAAVLGSLALYWGVPGGQVFGATYGTQLGAAIGAGDPLPEAFWNTFVNYDNFLKAGLKGIMDALDTRAQPLPTKRHFTIGELATVLESLASIVPLGTEQLKKATERHTFTSEAIVLQWLVVTDAKTSSVTSQFALTPVENLVDLSEFVAPDANGVQTRVHVDIEDPSSNDECKGLPSAHFVFGCNRPDKVELGYAAAGTIRDLERLQRAIVAFSRMLDAESAKQQWTPETYLSGLDYYLFNPLFSTVMNKWKYVRTNKSPTSSDQRLRTALQEQRATTLRYLQKNVQSKLHARFVAPYSEGDTLLRTLKVAVEQRFVKTPQQALAPPRLFRELPQKVQRPSFYFPTSTDTDSNYVDVQTEKGTMREFSLLYDAVKAGTRAARTAMAAIRIKHREWETVGQRCLFVHAFDVRSDWNARVERHRLRAPRESYSLVLQLPGDIRNAEAIVNLEEEIKRRILTLCHKGEAAAEATTLLDKYKLHNTEETLVAMSLFAELWTDELVRLHECTDPTLHVVSAVETAQARAAARCFACGQFLHDVTMQEWSGLVPMLRDDPALLATEAGRDAGRLARRMQLVAQPKTTRGVLSRALVKRVREIGAALRLTGNRLAAKPDAQLLPSEPLQALFMDPAHGVRAYKRAETFANLDQGVIEAISGAYPSSLLLVSNKEEAAISKELQFATLQRPPVPIDVAVKVQERMAALRFDYSDTVHLDASKTQLHASTEALTKAMSSLAIERGTRKLSYYVPYGHGHAPPRLAYPPVPTPMFGSVPVWVGDAIAAIDALLKAPPAETENASEVSIFPIFPCEANDASRPQPAHPALIDAYVLGSGFVDVCFWASEPELTNAPTATDDDEKIALFAHDAATRHVQQEDARKLSSRVSTLAWNAERFLQALLLLTDPTLDATPVVQLMLSNGDARIAVPERGETEEALKARLDKELEDATAIARRDANWHLAELRRTMDLVEGYLRNPSAFEEPPPTNWSAVLPRSGVDVPDTDPNNPDYRFFDVTAPVDGADLSQRPALAHDSATHDLAQRDEMSTDAGIAAMLLKSAAIGAATDLVKRWASNSEMTAEGMQWLKDKWNYYHADWTSADFSKRAIIGTAVKVVGGYVAKAAASKLYWWTRRSLVKVQAEALQERDRQAQSTGSTSTRVSKECELPFLSYGQQQWDEVFQQDMDTKTRRLGTPVRGAIMFKTTLADALKQDLNRLRDTKLFYIDDLLNKKDCPPRTSYAWEDWVRHSELIEQRTLDVFLDDAVAALNIQVDSLDTMASSNPTEVKRRKAYKTVVENLNSLYGTTQAPYASAVNLVYLRNCAILSAERYVQAKTAMENYERDRLARAEEQKRVRRVVRAHTLVAAVVGTAMARNALGSGAPHVRILRTPGQAELSDDDKSVMQGTLRTLRSMLQTGASHTTALRLGELCAIAQSVLG